MRKPLILIILIIANFTFIRAQTSDELASIESNIISFDEDIITLNPKELSALPISQSIKVVGIGEANHGTRELNLIQYQLVRFLILYRDFTTVTFEFPYPEGLLIDQYVKGENEEGINILTDRDLSEYNCDEFLSIIEFVKEYNSEMKVSEKVSFLGVDIFGKTTAFNFLEQYFSKVDPDQLSIFDKYRYLVPNIYLSMNQSDNKDFKKLGKQLLKLLTKYKDQYLNISSKKEYDRSCHLAEHLTLMFKGNTRAKTMATNILETIDKTHESSVYIAHNSHVGMYYNEVGKILKKELGDRYYAIGTDYIEGSFLVKNMSDRKNIYFDTLKVPRIPDGFAEKFYSLEGNFFFVDIPDQIKGKNDWLYEKNYISNMGMGFINELTPYQFRKFVKIPDFLDAVFIFKIIEPISVRE